MNPKTKAIITLLLFVFGGLLLVIGLVAPLTGYDLPPFQIEPNSVLIKVQVQFTDWTFVEGALVEFESEFSDYYLADSTNELGIAIGAFIGQNPDTGEVSGTVTVTYGTYERQRYLNYLGGTQQQENFYDVPPETPPEIGTLKVLAWDRTSESYVAISAILTSPDDVSRYIDVSETGYTLRNAKVGLWKVSGSYGTVNPIYDSVSGILMENQVLTLTLEFGTGESPPDGNADYLKFLNVATIFGLVCICLGVFLRKKF